MSIYLTRGDRSGQPAHLMTGSNPLAHGSGGGGGENTKTVNLFFVYDADDCGSIILTVYNSHLYSVIRTDDFSPTVWVGI